MRLIDSDVLVNGYDVRKVTEYDEAGFSMNYKAVPVDAIEEAPTVDAVEVVRCKDCKRHYDSKFGYVVCVWFNKTVRADGYCSYGCKMDAEARDVD